MAWLGASNEWSGMGGTVAILHATVLRLMHLLISYESRLKWDYFEWERNHFLCFRQNSFHLFVSCVHFGGLRPKSAPNDFVCTRFSCYNKRIYSVSLSILNPYEDIKSKFCVISPFLLFLQIINNKILNLLLNWCQRKNEK